MSSIGNVPHSGATNNHAERRGAERTGVALHAVLRFDDRLQVVQGTLCDLSASGCGLICQVAVAQNSKCTLQFDLPALGQLRGQTVSSAVALVCCMQAVGQAYQFRLNLRFVNLPAGMRAHLAAFVQQALGHVR
jgi:c-di-GMP-binding flagellar brake protein YcgR